MSPEVGRIVRTAIRSWAGTLRFCVIMVVVAATTVVPLYIMKLCGLPFFMR